MDNRSEVEKILSEEYGIKNAKELKKAINELDYLDIGPFCYIPKKEKGEKS